MVLIIWLTVFSGVSQTEAQGINLIFFLPIALLSCILHRKNGLVKIKPLLPAIFTGIVGAAAGALLAQAVASEILGKCFSGFILAVGIKELLSAKGRERD
ncbi:MAG: TSUP family transporter [Ruminococcus sp.]|nr:TSUP family transporter [Ruminococcus sp.]